MQAHAQDLRCGIDTGGTFTDLAVQGADGTLQLFKHPTVPSDPTEGILGVLRMSADAHGLDLDRFLARVDVLLHGTTRSTNAVLTGTTARTALLCTEGHPDSLSMREGGRPDPFNWTYDYPDPYIPRSLTFEVPERIGAEGEIARELDADAVVDILGKLRRASIEAIAVCLLWSIVNPVHELRIGELIDEHLPNVPYTLSHHLNPVLREYRRTSSTAIDASLKPIMVSYLAGLEGRLRDSGFAGRLLVISSAGGLMEPRDLAEMPILSINSGPAVAPIAARHFALADLGAETAVIADTGGTSYDVALVRRGEVPMTRETWLGPKYVGHITGFPAVDVRSIGAGGGSIASVDPGGMLHVGPASAGAVPGPAAYGRGGVHPTVTDGALVLGFLDPAYFLSGEMELDTAAAREAIETHVAEPLSMDVLLAATAILTLATEQMVQAIHAVTVEQGVDPRDAVLIGGGGAAGINAVAVARRLGCERVMIPDVGAALSAAGSLILDLAAEYSSPLFAQTDAFDHAAAARVFAGLAEQCSEFARRVGGESNTMLEYTAEARYAHQVWAIDLPLRGNMLADSDDVGQLIRAFHERHQDIFAVHDPSSDIHIVGLRARVSCGHSQSRTLQSVERSKVHAVLPSHREMYFGEHGLTRGRVWAIEELSPAIGRVEGPGVIESPFTTVVLDPGASAQRLPSGNLLLIP